MPPQSLLHSSNCPTQYLKANVPSAADQQRCSRAQALLQLGSWAPNGTRNDEEAESTKPPCDDHVAAARDGGLQDWGFSSQFKEKMHYERLYRSSSYAPTEGSCARAPGSCEVLSLKPMNFNTCPFRTSSSLNQQPICSPPTSSKSST